LYFPFEPRLHAREIVADNLMLPSHKRESTSLATVFLCALPM
jgi:hypothetical protein